jgi:hypothetical protein
MPQCLYSIKKKRTERRPRITSKVLRAIRRDIWFKKELRVIVGSLTGTPASHSQRRGGRLEPSLERLKCGRGRWLYQWRPPKDVWILHRLYRDVAGRQRRVKRGTWRQSGGRGKLGNVILEAAAAAAAEAEAEAKAAAGAEAEAVEAGVVSPIIATAKGRPGNL